MFESILRGRSRAQRAALSPDDRAVVDRMIVAVEHDPFLDGFWKTPELRAPVVFWKYSEGHWRIVYRLVDDRFVEIYFIERRD